MTRTRAKQAVEGIEITAAGGVVMVYDGFDRWLCRESAYDARYNQLNALPAYEGDDGQSDAYTDLCVVTGPIATVVGTNRGEYTRLVCDAVAAGLIDADTATSAYGVVPPSEYPHR